jgi:hypothetical protein
MGGFEEAKPGAGVNPLIGFRGLSKEVDIFVSCRAFS